jgi:hypothetical protein
MPISDIANIVISLQTAQALVAGFGIPLILGAHSHNTDRIRFYSSVSGSESDGFVQADAEHALLNTIYSQNPAPTTVAVGRRANVPTMRWAVTPVPLNSTTYILKVDGQAVTYTSDATATVSEINIGLKAAVDALGLPVTLSDQSTFLRVLANTPGAYHTVESPDVSKLGIAQDNVDAGVAADLAAIQLVDNSWYAVLSPFKSFAENQSIATWVESHEKLFLAESQDSAIITTALSGATDIATTLHTQALARTAVAYHQGDGTNLTAAWAGKVLPMDAGSETWKFKTLAGVTPSPLTDTHLANLRAKFCNFYYTVAGINMTAEGTVASDEWIDTVRGRDALKATMAGNLITAAAGPKKVPYTDAGAVIPETAVRSALQAFEDVGFLAPIPKFTVTVPKVAAQSTNDRQNRYFPNINFAAQLAGAVHKIGVNGTITP